MSDDEQAIRTLVETWMAATRAGDTDTLRELMTDDIVFMTPGGEPFGRDTFLAVGPGDAQFEGRNDIQEISIHGDVAFMRSFIEVLITPPAGVPRHLAGHALGILRKGDDGRWRLARDANLVMPKA